MSKLSDYLTAQKIDPRRIAAASQPIEALKAEDRAVRLARRRAKGGDESAKELAAKKRRSGRTVSQPTLRSALGGKKLGRRSRARLVRAVNALLKQKNKPAATASDLF